MRLLDKRYEEIKKIVVSLFTELNLYIVPVDCFKICELLGIRVIIVNDKKIFTLFESDNRSFTVAD